MKKYYGIELLRFFCSLSIVIYHWGTSFFYLNLKDNYPYKFLFNWIYANGNYAVSVFFVISGLVFSNIYLQQNDRTSFINFFIKRFARLYPLHILTLFLIIIIQFLFLKIFGSYQLYTFNDFYHFLLNISFVLGWDLEVGNSFNSPVWTVGLEIVIYFFFFFLITSINRYKIPLILFVYVIFLLFDKTKVSELPYIKKFITFEYFIDFVRLFFSGVFIFLIEQKYKNSKYLLPVTVVFLIYAFIGNFKLYLFCPSLVLLFVLIDNLTVSDKLKNAFQFLGNLTYSMYLFHTVTFLFSLFILKLFNKMDLFYSDLFFIFYLLLTVGISLCSFNYYEKILNRKIRENFLK